MSRRAQENVLAAVLLVVFGAIIAISLTYGPRTRLVPVPVAAFAILLVIGQIVVQNTGSADDLHVDMLEVLTRRRQGEQGGPPGAAGTPGADAESTEGGRRVVPGQGAATGRSPGAAEEIGARGRREAFAVVMVGLLLALVLLLGPIAGIFLFVLGYAAAIARMRWYACLALAAGVSVCLYVLFVQLLNTQLYPGILPGLL